MKSLLNPFNSVYYQLTDPPPLSSFYRGNHVDGSAFLTCLATKEAINEVLETNQNTRDHYKLWVEVNVSEHEQSKSEFTFVPHSYLS